MKNLVQQQWSVVRKSIGIPAVVSSILLYLLPSAFKAFKDNDVLTYPGEMIVTDTDLLANSARRPSKYPCNACLLAAYEVRHGMPIEGRAN